MDKRQLASYAYHNCELQRAIELIASTDVTAELGLLHVKALCELDDKPGSVLTAESYLRRFPEEGGLHYLHGMSLYLNGENKGPIEAAFLAATDCGHAGGSMGLAFLQFASQRVDEAIELLSMTRPSDAELDHIRRLMLFQVLAADSRLSEAETQLQAADLLLNRNPSLLRQLWGQLCWVRLLRAKGRFDAAAAVLDRIQAQLGPESTPRLFRNAAEARRMIDAKVETTNLILPPTAETGHCARTEALGSITRKPMLHSLYAFLNARGRHGATKEDIVEGVWEENYNPLIHDDRIYKAIGRLRKLLGDDLAQPRFLTQLGRSYVLNHPDKNPESPGEQDV